MLALITCGATLGLTAGVLPGPLQSYLIQTTLTQGWRQALPLVLSPLIADLPLILFTVFVLAQFPPEFIRVVQVVGGLFVLWLARAAWLTYRAGGAIGAGGEASAMTTRQLLVRAVLVNLLSPGPYIFWATVNGPLLVQGLRESVLHGAAFLLAFYGTFMGLLVILILVFNRVRSLSPRLTRALLLVIALMLLVFGLSLIAQGLGLSSN